MTIEIKEIAKDDFKATVALLHKDQICGATCIKRSGLAKMYDQVLNHNTCWVHRMWVVFDANAPVGVATIETPSYHNREILSIYVMPGYRRQGLGNQLVTLAKATGIFFDVYFTPTSRAIYSRHGFSKYLRNYAA